MTTHKYIDEEDLGAGVLYLNASQLARYDSLAHFRFGAYGHVFFDWLIKVPIFRKMSLTFFQAEVFL